MTDTMYEKIQESGLTEIILSCTSQLSAQVSCVCYSLSSSVLSLGSGCSLMATMLQVFSFLISLRAQDFTFGGLELLMTVTSLFTDIAGNTPFLTFTEPTPFPKT